MLARKYSGGRQLRQSTQHTTTNLRLSYILRFIDGLTTATMAFVVPLMIYNSTHSVAWSGLSFMLEWIPRLTAIPAAGPLIDRLGAAKFFVIADFARVIIVIGSAIWIRHDPHFWPALVVMAVLAGMLAESTFVAAEKMGVEVAGSRLLHRVQAVQVGIDQVVQVLGPVLGGLLIQLGNMAVFVSLAVCLGISVCLAWRLRRADVKSRLSDGTDKLNIIEGLRIIGKRPPLVHIIVGTALFNLLLALLLTITPAIIEQRFHRGVSSVSLVWSLAAIASVIMVGIASTAAQRFGVTRVGFVAAMVASVACLGAGFAHDYWVYVVCLSVFLAMDASYTVFIRTARARLIPHAAFGTTIGVFVLLVLAPYPIAGALVAVIPFRFIPELIITSTILTVSLSCWSFSIMDHQAINGSDGVLDAEYATS